MRIKQPTFSLLAMICMFIIPTAYVQAGSVTNVSVSVETPYTGVSTAGEKATYTVFFDLEQEIPSGGSLEILFPNGFGFERTNGVSCQLNGPNAPIEGTLIPNMPNGIKAEVRLPAGEHALPTPTGYSYTFNTCSIEVILPLSTGSTQNLSILTYDANDDLLDGNLLIPGQTIVAADTTSPISISITSPVAGENITAGTQDFPIMIERTGTRQVEYILFYQSLDSGNTWTPLNDMAVPEAEFSASGYEADQQLYAWDVPLNVSSSVRLKAVAYGVQFGIPVAEYQMSGDLNLIAAATQGTGNVLPGVPVRSLVKASGPAVYYYAEDGRRYVFPSESVFFSWYENFDSVITITDDELASLPFGNKRITMRSGTWLIKIQSDPMVYAVEQGFRRPIKNEAMAEALYGPSWNQKIVDISPTFFPDYKLSRDLELVHPWGTVLELNGQHYMAQGDGGGVGVWFPLSTLEYANMRIQSPYVISIDSDPGYILGQAPTDTDYLNTFRYWSPSLAY